MLLKDVPAGASIDWGISEWVVQDMLLIFTNDGSTKAPRQVKPWKGRFVINKKHLLFMDVEGDTEVTLVEE